MKFRFLGVSAIALVLGLSLAGCAKNSIVGKWNGSISLPGGRGAVNATVEYKPDGTETVSAPVMGQTVNASGTYTVKDNTITTTISSVALNGSRMPLLPQASQPRTATFTIDGDTLKLTSTQNSQTETLTRVK